MAAKHSDTQSDWSALAMELFKEFTFDAAHYLPAVPEGHKCGKMHGHTYKVKIGVTGTVQRDTGFIMDFADLKAIVKPLIDAFDHSVLNDRLDNPTCENLVNAIWDNIAHQVGAHGAALTLVEVWETPTSGCTKRHVFSR